MENEETPALIEGDGNTPAEQPTAEPTTEAIASPVSEDVNPVSKAPKTVPYEKFAETRRELKELKNLVNQRLPQSQPQGATPAGNELDGFVSEDGSVDIAGYTNWMRGQMPTADQVAEAVDRRQSQRELLRKEESELYEARPELKGDKERLDIIEAIRTKYMIDNDEYMSKTEAANRFFDLTGNVAKEARKSATENHTIQANAAPAPATGKVDNAAVEEANLKEAMNSPDEEVRKAARIKWLQNRNK